MLVAFFFDFLLSRFGVLVSNRRSLALIDHALVHYVGPVRGLVLARASLILSLLFASLLFQLASVGAPLLSALEALWEQEKQDHRGFLARQALAVYIFNKNLER